MRLSSGLGGSRGFFLEAPSDRNANILADVFRDRLLAPFVSRSYDTPKSCNQIRVLGAAPEVQQAQEPRQIPRRGDALSRHRPHQGDHGRFRSYRASKGGPPGLLGQKQKLKALSLKWVFETVPAFVPEADETRRRVIRRHLARGGAEN